MPRVDVHTTLDQEIYKKLKAEMGAPNWRWGQMGHALDYCVAFTLKHIGAKKKKAE